MKKWIAIFLAAILILTLAACRGKSVDEPTDNQTEQPAVETEIVSDTEKPEVVTDNTDQATDDHDTEKSTEEKSADDEKTESQSNDQDQPTEPDDPEEVENDTGFTGLETKEEEVIELEPGQGVGGF